MQVNSHQAELNKENQQITNRKNRRSPLSLVPDEILELIASQLVLSFRDVLAFSATARRIRSVLRMLTAQPSRIEDPLGTDMLDQELTDQRLIRAVIIEVNFTLADSQRQSEQLRRFLSRATHIRYLCIRRPALNQDPPAVAPHRGEMQRPKSATHPFPLRAVHFQHKGSYLGNLTHLELSGLTIHPFIFAHLPQLTHLKLSLAEQYDVYSTTNALEVIPAARVCKLVGFEIGGLYITMDNAERLRVVDACVSAWPDLEILNLFSLKNGKALGWASYSEVRHPDSGTMARHS
ncbi:hypothetical protein FRC06_003022 [Ceratobasidium sp. 370]|nr:hypothetical protein FRC06_003022 [Ceratobasidium sp. 370]